MLQLAPAGCLSEQRVEAVQSVRTHFPLSGSVWALGPRALVLGFVDLRVDRLFENKAVLAGQP